MCIYIYAYIYKQFWLCKCMYKYMYIYTYVYIYVYIYIYINQMCVSKYGIKIKSHHHLRECFAIVCSESQRLHHCHMCAMTHSYVCHDSFICVPWLIHMRAMTHSYVYHDSFLSQRLHHYHMCTPPHSLHRLYLRILLLSANLSVYPILYIYTRTHLHDDPQHTQNES